MVNALAHLNLLDIGLPPPAAILRFGAQPQQFLISSKLKCLHFHGRVVQKPIPSCHVFKGTVFELVDQAVDFVLSKLTARVGTRAEPDEAPMTYELPREAVAEAIVNAVMDRDYASNASVQVMLFADRLEIWNLGELPNGLTMEQLQRPHASIPRNPLLAEPMFLSRYAEKAGSGILDMIALCRAEGLPPPTFRQDGTAKRSKRVGIVALARKLLILLLRYVTQGVVPAGALVKNVTHEITAVRPRGANSRILYKSVVGVAA